MDVGADDVWTVESTIDDVNVKALMVAIHEYRDHAAGIAVSLVKDILSKKLQWSRDLIIEKLRSQDITVGKLAFGKTRQEQALEIFDLEIIHSHGAIWASPLQCDW